MNADEQRTMLLQRATAVAEAAAARPNADEAIVVRTKHGEVHIGKVKQVLYGDENGGMPCVEVFLDGDTEGGDPHFRIFNPPTLVEDPAGDVIGHGGKKYRNDPITAVAEVISRHGGARPKNVRRA